MVVSEDQKTLIRSTWKAVEGSVEETGLTMFIKLFTDNPAAIPLFRFTNNEPLEQLKQNQRLKRHGANVIGTVGAAVGLLDEVDKLVNVLKDLATRHIKYNISSSLFAPVGAALLYALENRIGDDWNAEVAAAWTALYGAVVGVMSPIIDKGA